MGWALFLTGLAVIALAPQLAGDNNERVVVCLVVLGYLLMAISLGLD